MEVPPPRPTTTSQWLTEPNAAMEQVFSRSWPEARTHIKQLLAEQRVLRAELHETASANLETIEEEAVKLDSFITSVFTRLLCNRVAQLPQEIRLKIMELVLAGRRTKHFASNEVNLRGCLYDRIPLNSPHPPVSEEQLFGPAICRGLSEIWYKNVELVFPRFIAYKEHIKQDGWGFNYKPLPFLRRIQLDIDVHPMRSMITKQLPNLIYQMIHEMTILESFIFVLHIGDIQDDRNPFARVAGVHSILPRSVPGTSQQDLDRKAAKVKLIEDVKDMIAALWLAEGKKTKVLFVAITPNLARCCTECVRVSPGSLHRCRYEETLEQYHKRLARQVEDRQREIEATD